VKLVEKSKTIKVLLLVLVLILSVMTAGCTSGKKVPANEGILGIWYECSGGIMEVVIFYDDDTFVRTPEEFAGDEDLDYTPFVYDEELGRLEFTAFEETATVTVGEDTMEYTIDDLDENHILYRDRAEAEERDPYYFMTGEFTDTIMDEYGFCIKDGILYAYRGDAEEVTVPDNVTIIYSEAFAGDYNHGVNLKKVIVPGSVEKIQSNAFAFTNADSIIIEEGVKELGSYVFMDSYIEEIRFPASLVEIGAGILETEEGLQGTKIYVPADSKIENYLKENEPYGDVEIIKE